jgi:hypothetical protein
MKIPDKILDSITQAWDYIKYPSVSFGSHYVGVAAEFMTMTALARTPVHYRVMIAKTIHETVEFALQGAVTVQVLNGENIGSALSHVASTLYQEPGKITVSALTSYSLEYMAESILGITSCKTGCGTHHHNGNSIAISIFGAIGSALAGPYVYNILSNETIREEAYNQALGLFNSTIQYYNDNYAPDF